MDRLEGMIMWGLPFEGHLKRKHQVVLLRIPQESLEVAKGSAAEESH
jgi:hypothetical protein